MKKTYKKYSREARMSLVRQYYESGMSKYGFCKSHGLSGTALLISWLRTYEDEMKLLSSQKPISELAMRKPTNESLQDEIASLKKRNKELEKALKMSQLETKSRDMMIDMAEAYFHIPIRKKSGVK